VARVAQPAGHAIVRGIGAVWRRRVRKRTGPRDAIRYTTMMTVPPTGIYMHPFSHPFSDRRRALVATRLAWLGLEHGLPHVAVIGAQVAARATLLAIAGTPLRPADHDIDLLRQVAALDRFRPAGGLAAPRDLAEAAIDVLHRLMNARPPGAAAG
jgi:hypothetical protein